MSWRDRFSELKDSVDEWRDGSADRGFDSQVEKHLTTLKSGSEQERAAAVKALLVQVQAAERWHEPIVKALLGTLPEQPAQAQLAIIEALLALRELLPGRQDDFFAAIQETLDSPYREVRLYVVKLWTNLSISSERRRDETIPDLFELLDDDDKNVRYATQEALGHVLHKAPAQALPRLRDALKHRDWRVRYHAIVLLVHLRVEREAPPLAFLKDPNGIWITSTKFRNGLAKKPRLRRNFSVPPSGMALCRAR